MKDRTAPEESMDAFCETVERWNEEEEYSLCIRTLEAIPEEKRDYRVIYLLARAYQNLVLYGDQGSGASEDEEEIEACMGKALELLDAIWDEGIDQPEWNELAAYSYFCLEEYALSVRHAKRWIKLDPENEEAADMLEVIEERWRQAIEDEEEEAEDEPDDEPEDEADDEPEDEPEDEPDDEPEDEPEDEPDDEPEDEPFNDTRGRNTSEGEDHDEYFSGAVLLERHEIDINKFTRLMQDFWDLKAEKLRVDANGNFIMEFGDQLILMALQTTLPKASLLSAAEQNNTWPQAEDAVRRYRGAISIVTSGAQEEALHVKGLLIKILYTLCKMYNALAIHLNSVLYQPDFFLREAQCLFRGNTPVHLMVWIGRVVKKPECFCFTAGLNQFGTREIEMVPTTSDPDEVYRFLTELTREILEGRIVMRTETCIGPPGWDRFMVTCSDGIVHDEKTFKMKYW